jgi:hypothetical protein
MLETSPLELTITIRYSLVDPESTIVYGATIVDVDIP